MSDDWTFKELDPDLRQLVEDARSHPRRSSAPQDDAYWALRGCIGHWMDAYHVERERTLLYLARITAEVRCSLDCYVLTRLQALEAAGEEETLLR